MVARFSSTPIFVGRRNELKQFDEVLRDPVAHAVLVVGPAGMGKTLLVEQMMRAAVNHPDLECGAVRYEVTPTDSVDSILELMLDHAYDAAAMEPGSLVPTDQRRKQWQALFKAIVPKGDKLLELAQSLKRDPAKNTRDQFLHRITLVAKNLPENGRAVFVIDPEKYMARDSDQAWAIVTRGLPPKVKLVFAQRTEDVLVHSQPFSALDNLVRIPSDDLDALDQDAVDELIAARAPDIGLANDVLRNAVARYDGRPYAVDAALKLIHAGMPIEDLPADPGGIARAQWDKTRGLKENAIPFFQAHAILEVAAPDDVVAAVSGLDSKSRMHLLANPFLQGLLRDEAEGRRIYHALLADCIRSQIDSADASEYHKRAIDIYRTRLNADVKPDALAAKRLPEHVLAHEGEPAFITCFVNECGKALMDLGILDTFIVYSNRALAIAAKGSIDEAMLLGNLGSINLKRGDLGRAEAMYREALEITKQLGLREGMANQYGNLGNVYFTRGDLDQAEQMHKKSLEINRELGRREGMAADYGNLGNVYFTRRELDQAEQMYKRSLEINRELGRREGMALNYGNLGNVYFTRGDLDQAEQMYRKSLEIDRELGLREGMANQYSNLGSVCERRGDLTGARENWIQARDLFEKIGMPHMVQQVQGWLDTLD